MTEMIHVTEGEDIGNLLKTNFLNTRLLILAQEGAGLFDQLELYKGLIKNYNVDYVILYITENDFENNFAVSQKTKVFNQPKFFVDKNSQKIIKIDRDYSKLNEQYFSKFNKFKRSK